MTQFLFSPIFIGVFLASLLTLEGRPSDVVPKLQQVVLNARFSFDILLILYLLKARRNLSCAQS